MSKFIEIGFTAARDPATGGFLPAVPLYIEETEEARASEGKLIRDIGRVFAEKHKQYIAAGGLNNHPKAEKAESHTRKDKR